MRGVARLAVVPVALVPLSLLPVTLMVIDGDQRDRPLPEAPAVTQRGPCRASDPPSGQ